MNPGLISVETMAFSCHVYSFLLIWDLFDDATIGLNLE